MMDRHRALIRLCQHRGFIFPSSQLYGGLANSYDYGPLGTLMKKNITDIWWKTFVQKRMDIQPLDSSILLHPKVWKASGHVDQFVDPMTICKNCNVRSRADHIVEKQHGSTLPPRTIPQLDEMITTCSCPECGKKELQSVKQFNLLFQTSMGAVEESNHNVFLRPETAQGAYINFQTVQQSLRLQIPFGLAQIGKSFRNEISPSNFIFRTREFEQMELQYFCPPSQAETWYTHWADECIKFLSKYGLKSENVRIRVHTSNELAHYAVATSDIEYKYGFGWGELWGIANRGNHDLMCHMKASKTKYALYTDPKSKETFVPHVIEPAVGLGRLLFAFLSDAYDIEKVKGKDRTILRLHREIAPYEVSILPLSNKPELTLIANRIAMALSRHFRISMDVNGSIGRRYRRQDEIGTPFCLTVDFETNDDNCVTIRSRDCMSQIRVPIEEIVHHLIE